MVTATLISYTASQFRRPGHRISVLAELVVLDNKGSKRHLLFNFHKSGVFGALISVRLTFGQIIFVVEHYFANKSFVFCQEAFLNEAIPNKTTVQRQINKFREIDSVCNRKHIRGPTVLCSDTLEEMRLILFQSPSKSLRKRSQQKNMSLGSAHKPTHLLKLDSYRVNVIHEFRPTDQTMLPDCVTVVG